MEQETEPLPPSQIFLQGRRYKCCINTHILPSSPEKKEVSQVNQADWVDITSGNSETLPPEDISTQTI
jgi:hypothetical protein